jgi:hypothetical protein
MIMVRKGGWKEGFTGEGEETGRKTKTRSGRGRNHVRGGVKAEETRCEMGVHLRDTWGNDVRRETFESTSVGTFCRKHARSGV